MAASSSSSTKDSEMAFQTWNLENNIQTLPACDEIYHYNADKHQQVWNRMLKYRLLSMQIRSSQLLIKLIKKTNECISLLTPADPVRTPLGT